MKPEVRDELSRARRLVSPEFVVKMKAKFKESALKRIEAEKEVRVLYCCGWSDILMILFQSADAAVDDEECPICFDAFTDAVVTPCTHMFCRECLGKFIHSPTSTVVDHR